jgi:hypothetical protein
MNKLRCFLFGATCLLSMAASAHWEWIDKAGVKVFSDRAPPSDIPEKDVVRRPELAPLLALPASAPVGAGAGSVESGVDKALIEKKMKAEEAQAGQRKELDQKTRQVKADNCGRAKLAKTTYESGIRISRVNDKGEIEFLDDAARRAELKRIQGVIDSDCS